MKTKTVIYTVVGILIVLVIVLLIVKKSEAPVQAPAFDEGSSSSVSSPTGTKNPKAAPAPAAVKLNGGSHGTTTNLVVGQNLIVTVQDPTDAGYTIDPVQYTAGILGLVSHTHTPIANTNGSDTFEFTALKTGTTGMTITATQGANKNSTVTLFTNAISVK